MLKLFTRSSHLLCFVLLISSCSGNHTETAGEPVAESSALADSVSLAQRQMKDKQVLSPDSVRKYLPGIWGSEDCINACFAVEKDSVYYPESGSYYLYELKSDSFTIYYDDFVNRGKILKVDADSLVMVNQLGIDRMFRFDQ